MPRGDDWRIFFRPEDCNAPMNAKPKNEVPLPVLDGLNVDAAVRERYSAAARAPQAQLCAPSHYDPRLLAVLPAEILQRDYGCGNPSRWAAEGETVLDLGSGGGKICYIAAQIVGPQGRVVGVDVNDDMLALARRHHGPITQALGYDNVRFHKARIQDLALDLEVFETWLTEHPVQRSGDWLAAQEHAEHLRRTQPMIADNSIDAILSNCVLNLVRLEDRQQLFAEMFRVLRPGGRAVISDITSDEPVPDPLRRDPQLWSGCISGAFQESAFLAAFESAGFYGVQIVDRSAQPWAVVEGIELRSLTVRAYKPPAGEGRDRRQAVIYTGPWKHVADDEGHVLHRGLRMAVDDRRFALYTQPPYADGILAVPPRQPVPDEQARPFDGRAGTLRDPRETKGEDRPTRLPGEGCCG